MRSKEEIVLALTKEKERLEIELRKMREFHLAAWKEYGSELCASEMQRDESKLTEKIGYIAKFLEYHEYHGAEVSEGSFRSAVDHLKESQKAHEEKKSYHEKQIQGYVSAVEVVKEMARIAGVEI